MTRNIARYSSDGIPSPERLWFCFSVFWSWLVISTLFAFARMLKLWRVPLVHIALGVCVDA